jgi:CheY-like chemotaxis protein
MSAQLMAASRALRIMVVEDEAINAMLLAEVLEDMGHSVCAIEATEAGAIAAAATCNLELMIVDATLGDGSGVAAVVEILRSGPVPCVFVTGDASRVTRLQPHAVVLQKPFRLADLEHAIERALASGAASI